MPRKGHTEEQILQALRQAEGGERVTEVCRKLGISEQTFYTWRRKYAGVGLGELRELRQLRDENGKLKKLVADLSLDRHMLQEIVRKSSKASSQARVGALDTSRLPGERASGVEAASRAAIFVALQDSSRPAGTSADAIAGASGQSSAIWIPAVDRIAEARGVGGERKTDLSALHRGRIDRADEATKEGSKPPARASGPSDEAE